MSHICETKATDESLLSYDSYLIRNNLLLMKIDRSATTGQQTHIERDYGITHIKKSTAADVANYLVHSPSP